MRRLYMTGSGDSGQLGTGKKSNELTPVAIPLIEQPNQVSCGLFHTGVLSNYGHIFTTGANQFGQLGTGDTRGCTIPTRIDSLSDINFKKIACSHHTVALSSSN